MKKLVTAFFLFSFSFCVNGQQLQFKCYLKSSCTDTLKILKNYDLVKGKFLYSSMNSGEVATLRDTGFYVLKSYELAADGDSLLVHISKGLNTDTLKQKDVYEVIQKSYNKGAEEKAWAGWVCCGKRCAGVIVDYYANGKKRLEGNFKNGHPIGEFKFYHPDGTPKYFEYYSSTGKLIKSKRF